MLFLVIVVAGFASAYWIDEWQHGESVWIVGGGIVAAMAVFTAIKVASPWQRAIVLRLGSFRSVRGPGWFGIIPIIDAIPYWIDIRVITTSFAAEKSLTMDTVPVDVDAVLFWKVVDPQKAAVEVADYKSAMAWVSQTALRDVIGKANLSQLLEGREQIGLALQRIIDERTAPWGINVIAVEIRDVLIPAVLQDAMSMQAQAEREREARVILGDSEQQIAEKFGKAAQTYRDDPVALHLRAMNMLYEGIKDNSTIVIVPSTALDSMQLGAAVGLTGLSGVAKRAAAAPVPYAAGPLEDVPQEPDTIVEH